MADLLEGYLETLPTVKPSMQIHWPLDFPVLTNVRFTPFGLVGPDSIPSAVQFSKAWYFEYEKAGSGAGDEVKAMFVGEITWYAELDGGAVVLTSAHYPSITINLINKEYPEWFPRNEYLIYSTMDTDSVKTAVIGILNDPITKENLVFLYPFLSGLTNANIADIFIDGHPDAAEPLTIPVKAGTILGSPSPFRGKFVLKLEATETIALDYSNNLSYFIDAYKDTGYAPDPSLLPATIQADIYATQAPAFGNGLVIRVNSSGDPGTHATIGAAVGAASEGTTILIEGPATYQESSEIAIDKALSIIGSVAGNARSPATPDFPICKGRKPPDSQREDASWAATANRLFKCTAINSGMIQISNLYIRDSADRQGGAIYADECHQLWINNCIFTHNEAYAGGWLQQGFGGAIANRHASLVIKNCLFTQNKANCRGGAIGIFGYGWPIITDCTVRENTAGRTNVANPVTGNPFSSRPDGGGIALQGATPKKDFEADFDMTFFLAETHADTLEDLMSVSSLVTAIGSAGGSVRETIVNFLVSQINDPLFQARHAEILIDLMLHEKSGYSIVINTSNLIDKYWDPDQIKETVSHFVVINRCSFNNNISKDDGGGVYATGLVLAICKDMEVNGNKSVANGGGLRISTSCDFTISDSVINNNESNSDRIGHECGKNYDEDTWEWEWKSDGGGGIGCRDSNLALHDVFIEDNKAHRFAGGGIYFISTDEGAIQGGGGLGATWNSIREIIERDGDTGDKFPRYEAYNLSITGGRIINNCTGWCGGAAGKPRPTPTANCTGSIPTQPEDDAKDIKVSKGGGIYAMRYKNDGTEYTPIHLSISSGVEFENNTGVFSESGADASDLFIADFTVTAGSNNPVKDTADLNQDSTGTLTIDYTYP